MTVSVPHAAVTGEVRTISATGAAKGVKPEAFDLVPAGPLKPLARWYGSNAVKFSEAKSWEPIFNYLVEHLSLFWLGEDTDEATGLPHTISVAAAALELLRRDARMGTEESEDSEDYTPLTVIPWRGNTPPPARYDLIPAEQLVTLARHYGAGAAKYAKHNWAAGSEWGKLYAAMSRHLWAARGGEHIDAETGSPHMVAVAWHAVTLSEFSVTHPELDDRPVRGTQRTNMDEEKDVD